MNDNLQRVYATLKNEGFDLPEYDVFANDMRDDNNLSEVRESLVRAGYTPPEFNVFKVDMFGEPVKEQEQPKSGNVVSPVIGEGLKQDVGVLDGAKRYDKVSNQPVTVRPSVAAKMSPEQIEEAEKQVENEAEPITPVESPKGEPEEQKTVEVKPQTTLVRKNVTFPKREDFSDILDYAEAYTQAIREQEAHDEYYDEMVKLQDDNTPQAEMRKKIAEARRNFKVLPVGEQVAFLEKVTEKSYDELKKDFFDSHDAEARTPDTLFRWLTGGNSYQMENSDSEQLTKLTNKADARRSEYGGFSQNEILSGLAPEEVVEKYQVAEYKKATDDFFEDVKGKVDVLINNLRADYDEEFGVVEDFFMRIVPKVVNFRNEKEDFAIGADAQDIRAAKYVIDATDKMRKAAIHDKNGWDAFWERLPKAVNFAGDGSGDAALAIYRLSEKIEKGEELTLSEQILEDALISQMMVADAYAKQVDGSYALGENLADMGAFMIETAFSPGKGTAKSLAKQLVKKFKNKYARRLAAGGGRFIGAAIEGGIAAVTTASPRVAEGALEKMAGKPILEHDENGEPRIAGFKDQEGAWEAAGEAFLENTVEFGTEALGAEWITKALSKPAKVILGKTKRGQNLMKGINRMMKDNKYVRGLKNAINYDGVAEEFLEEFEAAILNPTQSVEEFLEPDNLVNTLIMVAIPGTVFSTANTIAGAATGAYKTGAAEKWKMQQAAYRATMPHGAYRNYLQGSNETAAWTPADWAKEQEIFDNGTVEDVEKELKRIYSDSSLTPEQKLRATEYAIYSLQYRAAKGVKNAMSDERKAMLDDMLGGRYEEGYNTDPATVNGNTIALANKALDDARVGVRAALNLGEDADVDAIIAGKEFEGEAKAAVDTYLAEKAKFEGMRDRFNEQRENEIAEAEKEVDAVMHEDGNVYMTTLPSTGEAIFITGGKVVLDNEGYIDVNQSEGLVALMPNGKKEAIQPGNIREKVAVENAEAQKVAKRAEIDARYKNQLNTFVYSDSEGDHTVMLVGRRGDMVDALIDGKPTEVPAKEFEAIMADATGKQPVEVNAVKGEKVVTGDNVPAQATAVEQPVANEVPVSAPVEQLPKEKQTPAPIPTEKRGKTERAAYHLVPIERTMEDLHDGALEADEIESLIDARIKEAENDVKATENKKPVIGADKDAYVAAKKQWREAMDAAKAKLDYYNNLKAVNAEVTRSEMREAVEGVAPQTLIEQTADEFVANQLGGWIKITPESFQKETGLKAEQKQMVGVIAGKDKGGMTIEQAAETILENYGDELRGLGFNGDMQDMRDMIINILSNGNPRSYAKKGAEMRAQESVEQQRSELESVAHGLNFNSIEEQIEYEEAVVPRIIQDYTGFDEQEYFNNLAENYEYDTTREGEGTRGGSELLQGEQAADNAGVGDITESGQGGEIQGDVYSGGENAASQGNQQVSSPEIPNGLTGEVVPPVESTPVAEQTAVEETPQAINEMQPVQEVVVPTAEEVADAQAFATAAATNTAEEYQAYLDNYPNGAYRDGARAGMWMIEGVNPETHGLVVDARNAANEVLSRVEGAVEGGNAPGQSGVDASEGNSLANAVLEKAAEKQKKNLNDRIRKAVNKGRIQQWEKRTGVSVRVVESIDEVTNRQARAALEAGQIVKGWIDGNEVVIYLPNIESVEDVDKTYIHEVVAHKGLKILMGKDFDKLCDKVWEMMSEEQRREYLAYIGANLENPTQQQMRDAADEYMAHLAESVELTETEKGIWRKIVDAIREFLLGEGVKLTDKDIENLIRASYANLASGNTEGGNGGTMFRLASSNASAIKYDKMNGTNVKEFFDFLRGGMVFEKGKPNVFHIANAGNLLEQYGIKGKFMVGQFTFSRTHTQNEDHNLGIKEWVDVINNLNNPLAITSYKGLPNEYRIYTYATVNGKNICVGVNVSLKEGEIELSNIISAYGRDINNLLGKEGVNLLYPDMNELKRKISQVSTAHNSLLNATSTAYADKDNTGFAKKQGNGTKFRKVTPEMDAEYMAAVENGDMETAERLVKEAAKLAMPDTKVVDEDGYPMVVYHGSEEDFNVFDKTKGRANMDIQGMFFSPWDDDARGYGSNVRAFFLNITKPANESTGYKALNKFQGQNGAGIKAREYLISAGYDGVNNEDQEFVAFDPNQIKSADAVTYDDNGNVIPLSERFNEENNDIRFRKVNENQDIFVSNAQRAVEGIKQEKATPEQWVAMLKKNGGLKAGEDKWMGLSEWLENNESKSLTKQEVLDFVNENAIKIEEVEYGQGLVADEGIPEYIYDGFEEIYNELRDSEEIEDHEEIVTTAWERFTESQPDWVRESIDAIAYSDGTWDLEIVDNYVFENHATESLGINAINSTRLDYTTEGLENKREIALVVPTVEPYNASDEIHFGDAGNGRAVAWVRFGETTADTDETIAAKKAVNDYLAEMREKYNTLEGEETDAMTAEEIKHLQELTAKEMESGEKKARVLVIDEIQSKRHQDAREKGYKSSEAQKLQQERDALYDKMYTSGLSVEEHNRFKELGELLADVSSDGVPAAPFEKNWHELAMKRMLRLAAEEGFDKMAWTTGGQQAQRYNLGAVLKGLKAYKTSANEYYVIPYNNGAIGEFVKEYTEKELADTFGKELAQKIITNAENATEENPYEIEGEELRVGGEGMKGFYDKMLPSFVQKYTKKWGAKVGEVTMPNLRENNTMHSVDVTPEMQESVMEGQTMFRMGSRVDARMAEVASHFDGKELTAEQRSVVDVFGGKADNLTISVKTKDGNTRNVEMRQGNDLAGAKHSLYAHYGTTKGVINADDLLLIPDVIANGERTENGKKAVYKLDVNGTKYTVVTYVKQNKEEFHNFYSNKKGQPSQSVNASIGDTHSARITEELASADKGNTNSAEMQEERTLFSKNELTPEQKAKQEALKENAKAIRRLHNVTSRYPITALRNLGFALETQEQREMHDRLVAERDAITGESKPAGLQTNPQAMTLQERITESLLKHAEQEKENVEMRLSAIRAYGRDLANVIKLMNAQKVYDRNTVRMFTDLVKMYLRNNAMKGMSSYEVMRLLNLMQKATGGHAKTVNGAAVKIAEIITNEHTKQLEAIMEKQIKTGREKVNASGVVVQGGVDIIGKRVLNTYRDAIAVATEEDFKKRYDAAFARVGDLQKSIENAKQAGKDTKALENLLKEAQADADAMLLAANYRNEIKVVEEDIEALKSELSGKRDALAKGEITRGEYYESAKTINSQIVQMRAKQIDAYQRVLHALSGDIYEGVQRARAFREAEAMRVQRIHDMAENDMNGVSKSAERKEPGVAGKTVDMMVYKNPLTRAVMHGLGTYENYMKYFGRDHLDGRGELFEYFMTAFNQAQDKEWKESQNDFNILEAAAQKIFGKKKIGKTYKTIARDSTKGSGVILKYWNGGAIVERELTIGQLMYLYMTEKQTEGQMKLRNMGLTEEKVKAAVAKLPAKYKAFADYIQTSFLPEMRPRMNEVHQRMFGASMSEVENYFPLKVNQDARKGDTDLNNTGDAIPSTITGAVIKRRVNVTPIDLTANAFDVLNEHIVDMEHWAAFAEFTRDNNTLINDNDFKNRVKNTKSIRHGDGETLWKDFVETARITTGNYQQRRDYIAKLMSGANAAKITFGYYTALKQLASLPAFLADANAIDLVWNTAKAYGSWQWAIKNLPGFEERWKGRTGGNERLGENEYSIHDSRIMKAARMAGMTPNAFIDAAVVAAGARAVYETRLRFYKKLGMTEYEADRRAKNDAAISYNETQQSGQGAYLSRLQKEGGIAALLTTLFRNSQMAFQRRVVGSLVNTGKKLARGERIREATKRKYMQMGMDEAAAEKRATKEFYKSYAKDITNLAIFGYGMNYLWVLMGQLPYLLFGDDDEEKEKIFDMAKKVGITGMFEGFTLGNVAKAYYENKVNGTDYAVSLLEAPFEQDLDMVLSRFEKDGTLAGILQLGIFFTEMNTGISPQRLIDDLAAVIDFCDGDVELANDGTLFALRMLKAPQSQQDMLILDELEGADAERVKKVAEKFIEYKMTRNFPFGSEDEKRVDKYANKFVETLKERVEKDYDPEDISVIYDQSSDTEKEILKKKWIEGMDERNGTNVAKSLRKEKIEELLGSPVEKAAAKALHRFTKTNPYEKMETFDDLERWYEYDVLLDVFKKDYQRIRDEEEMTPEERAKAVEHYGVYADKGFKEVINAIKAHKKLIKENNDPEWRMGEIRRLTDIATEIMKRYE